MLYHLSHSRNQRKFAVWAFRAPCGNRTRPASLEDWGTSRYTNGAWLGYFLFILGRHPNKFLSCPNLSKTESAYTLLKPPDGLEPPYTDYKSVVLPLHHGGKWWMLDDFHSYWIRCNLIICQAIILNKYIGQLNRSLATTCSYYHYPNYKSDS